MQRLIWRWALGVMIAMCGAWPLFATEPVEATLALSAPVPLTLPPGADDTTEWVTFFDHPLGSGVNFTEVRKDIALPSGTLQVQDLLVAGNVVQGACQEWLQPVGGLIASTSILLTQQLFLAQFTQDQQAAYTADCATMAGGTDAINTGTGMLQSPAPAWCDNYVGSTSPFFLCGDLLDNFFDDHPLHAVCVDYLINCNITDDTGDPASCPAFQASCKAAGFAKIAQCLQALQNPAQLCPGMITAVDQCNDTAALCTTPDAQACQSIQEDCKGWHTARTQHASCAQQGKTGAECATWKSGMKFWCQNAEQQSKALDKWTPNALGEKCDTINAVLTTFATQPQLCATAKTCAKPPLLHGQCPEFDALCATTGLAPGDCTNFFLLMQGGCELVAPYAHCDKQEILCEGKTPTQCTRLQQQCDAITNQQHFLFPVGRVVATDLRSSKESMAVANASEVVLNAEAVAPYAVLPPIVGSMDVAVVVEGAGGVEGVVGLVTQVPGVPAGDQTTAATIGAMTLAYYRLDAAQPTLSLQSIGTGYMTPDVLKDPAHACFPMAPGAQGTMEAHSAQTMQANGCVAEAKPQDLVALNLFGEAPFARDLVVLNRGALPADPSHSFVTIYRRTTAASADATRFESLWQYHGFAPVGREPYRMTAIALDNGRQGVLVAANAKDDASQQYAVYKVMALEPGVQVAKIPVGTAGTGWEDYGPYDITAGDFNQDGLIDFAISWMQPALSPDTVPRFAPFVSVYHGAADGTYSFAARIDAPLLHAQAGPKISPATVDLAASSEQSAVEKSVIFEGGPVSQESLMDSMTFSVAGAQLAIVRTCDLDRDGTDGLCVGDQTPYPSDDGGAKIYLYYYPPLPGGGLDTFAAREWQVNTRSDFLPDPPTGLGGVKALVLDRHQNVAVVMGVPRVAGAVVAKAAVVGDEAVFVGGGEVVETPPAPGGPETPTTTPSTGGGTFGLPPGGMTPGEVDKDAAVDAFVEMAKKGSPVGMPNAGIMAGTGKKKTSQTEPADTASATDTEGAPPAAGEETPPKETGTDDSTGSGGGGNQTTPAGGTSPTGAVDRTGGLAGGIDLNGMGTQLKGLVTPPGSGGTDDGAAAPAASPSTCLDDAKTPSSASWFGKPVCWDAVTYNPTTKLWNTATQCENTNDANGNGIPDYIVVKGEQIGACDLDRDHDDIPDFRDPAVSSTCTPSLWDANTIGYFLDTATGNDAKAKAHWYIATGKPGATVEDLPKPTCALKNGIQCGQPGNTADHFECICLDYDGDGICQSQTPDGKWKYKNLGVPNIVDNCPYVKNPDQQDLNQNGVGDVCEGDADADTIPDDGDNCPFALNIYQSDGDADGVGDACDACTKIATKLKDGDHGDADSDGIANACDNCAQIKNANQKDSDFDGKGDACDPCPCGEGEYTEGNVTGCFETSGKPANWCL